MIRQRLSVLVAGLWWGSLVGLGLVVVPLLFRHLPSPAAAGAMAAQLFSAQTWLSAACCVLMLLALNKPDDPQVKDLAKGTTGPIVAGLLLALLIEFALAPQIVLARASGGHLRLWHGLGSAMYLLQWACAGWVLWRLSRSPARY